MLLQVWKISDLPEVSQWCIKKLLTLPGGGPGFPRMLSSRMDKGQMKGGQRRLEKFINQKSIVISEK